MAGRPGIAEQIAAFGLSTRFAELPPEAVAAARGAFQDTIGVALAGWHEPAARSVRELYAGGDGAPLLGERAGATPELAALLNGTAAHALDYDDVSLTMTGHPSAVVVPAVLAAGHFCDRSGADVLTAYLIGVEVTARVGEALGFGHYQLGWHSTVTVGTVGAAAAAAHLFRLPAAAFRAALGIAASLSGGLRRNFGTMTKPLHAGLAAQNGVRAALLASRGFTADADIFGANGYFTAFSGGRVEAPERLPLGEPWDVLANGLSVKVYPCCYATHRIIDGALGLAREHGVRPDDVAALAISAPAGALVPLNIGIPRSGLEGKFSAHYTAAAAVLDGRVTLATFEDEAVRRPEVLALAEKVTAREVGDITAATRSIEGDGPMRVTLTRRSGEVLSVDVDYASGAPQRPLSELQRWEKFADCVAFYAKGASVAAGAAERLYEACATLERHASVRAWWDATRLGGPSGASSR